MKSQIRSLRRYQQKIRVIRRLKHSKHFYYRTVNGWVENPRWTDIIGSETHFMYKSYVTDKFKSIGKNKWRDKLHYSWNKKSYRVIDKRKFLKELGEYFNEQ